MFKQLVEKDGYYYIRKFEIFVGWLYLDRTRDYWWYKPEYLHHAAFASKEEARKRSCRFKFVGWM